MNEVVFEAFPKIPRLYRECVITEKIDGSNASILVSEAGEIKAASRTRWITPQDDNFGFARWVEANGEDLKKLGPGHHFGEWWGLGIQRGYGLKEKRFSLFNSARWNQDNIPSCCHVVPIIFQGAFTTLNVEQALEMLKGSSGAAPGYDKPEGIVIWHEAARQMFKVTLEGDEKGKGA